MILSRRQWLQGVSTGLAFVLLSGCGVDSAVDSDTDAESDMNVGGIPLEDHDQAQDQDRLDMLADALSDALPLDELNSILLIWLGIRSNLSLLAPLGARALTQSTESALEWEEALVERFIEPLAGISDDEIVERLHTLCLQDYDLIYVLELGGWWLSDREMLTCVLAYLIDRQES